MKGPGIELSSKKRIFVVDDHPLFREGLVQFINRQDDLACCGEASSAASAQATVASPNPDLVILDLRLENSDGLELIKNFQAQYPALPVLVLSQMDENLYAERALRAGAKGYVMKSEATEEVLTAVRTVLGGDLYVSRKISILILHRLLEAKPEGRNKGVDCLTDRELQVFQMVGAGMNTKKVASNLSLSTKTIETYRENIKNKLGLRNAKELVDEATQWVRGAAPNEPSSSSFLPNSSDSVGPKDSN
ncbi:MAG: response regulator transcription factor [Verrucomicrobiota bacterium]